MGVINVRLSFRAISWVIPSPICSTSLMRLAFSDRIPEVFHHILEEATSFDHVVRRILEQIEKSFFPRNETEHNVLASFLAERDYQRTNPVA